MNRQATSVTALWQQCECEFDDSIAQMQVIIDHHPNHIQWHMLLAELVALRDYARAQQSHRASEGAEVAYDA